MTDWLIRGDIMRLPSDRLGQVVGLGETGRVLLRLEDGTVVAVPEAELTGTGEWRRVNDD